MNNTEMKLSREYSGKRVTLLGAGISNRPLAAMLVSLGAKVSVRDKKTAEQLGATADRLRECGAELILGEDYLSGIDEDIIIRSPGFRPDLPELAAAVDRGSRLSSEMECFLDVVPCPVFAVTGSAGKTTTTTLISRMLDAACKEKGDGSRMFLGGNIGEPLFNRVRDMTERDAVAVELSSFQLMTVATHFDTAVITNITPNHLNWHTDMQEYIDAKARILRDCRCAVLNYGDENVRALEIGAGVKVTYFSRDPIPLSEIGKGNRAIFPKDGVITAFCDGKEERLLALDDIRLPGMHNAENYMAAIGATYGMVSLGKVREIARTFGGVPHRLELVASKNGIAYYNSSIDSTPERTAAALSALVGKKIVLICGGYDKNLVYEPLADAIFSHGGVRAVVLNGATAPKIEKVLREHADFESSGLQLLHEPLFDSAVRAASDAAHEGDCVVLSPAAASFDQFENFEKRGERFREVVGNI